MKQEYINMSTDELKAKMTELEKTFSEYHAILTEVYGNMHDLSTEYNIISEILAERNEE